jgi:polyphosphate kinase
MRQAMPVDLNSPELYTSRQLSWLEFNHRVLAQGCDDDVPLMERLKFLAITSSNLDEFFMIRVAGLKQQAAAGVEKPDISGLSPVRQLERISERAHRMVAEQSGGIRAATGRLADHGLRIVDPADMTAAQRRFLSSYFGSEAMPLLTPLAVEELEPFPLLPGLQINLALALRETSEPEAESRIAIVPVPGNLPRFVTLPAEEGMVLARLEDAVALNVGRMFPDFEITGSCLFRLTRDADVAVHDEDVADLLQAIEEAVRSRRRRSVVRLEMSADPPAMLREWLVDWSEVEEADIYEVGGMLDATALMDVAGRQGFEEHRDPAWPAVQPRGLSEDESIWETLQDRDVMLFHPYESFEPVIGLVEAAATDPGVLAIRQTLYRTSGDSPIVAALARAAENGKQVTVLVELKARFDEARNANWARTLEDAGCHVIYGIAGLKTHAKLLLIIRRESHGVRRYIHLSTGNYNDRTAKLYSDIGLMTTDQEFAVDAASFFNLLTGYSQDVGWERFAISPTGLRSRIEELIEREIESSTPEQPGLIMAKVNSLHDRPMCRALYRASQAGVQLQLNVRGICCLKPGVKGVSDNIRVTSIVDRYLEHARVFYFRNGGHEEIYLSSADWMTRNLDRRLELLFPVQDPAVRRRLIGVMETYFADNVKAWELNADGEWSRIRTRGDAVRAQEALYERAVEAAEAQQHQPLQFEPLMNPREER